MLDARTVLLGAALVALAQASLAAQGRDAGAGPKCAPAAYAKGLPHADAVIDSARAALLFAAADTASPAALAVSVQFARGGELLRLAVVGGTMELDSARVLVLALSPLVRPQERADDPWGVRLQVRLAPSPGFEITPSWFCPPQFLRMEHTNRTIGVDISQGEARRVVSGGRVTLRVRVGVDGKVEEVRRVGSTGAAALDEELVLGAYDGVYTPPRLDGLPIDVWIESQARVTTEQRRRP